MSVGAEDFPQLLVATLADEVEVNFAEAGQEPVGVISGEGISAVGNAQAVVRHCGAGHLGNPDATVFVFHLQALVADHHRHRRGCWAKHSDGHRLAFGVGAEHLVRVGVAAIHQRIYDGVVKRLGGHHAAPLRTCRMCAQLAWGSSRT